MARGEQVVAVARSVDQAEYDREAKDASEQSDAFVEVFVAIGQVVARAQNPLRFRIGLYLYALFFWQVA